MFVIRNIWPIRNNLRVTKKFLITKFDCSSLPSYTRGTIILMGGELIQFILVCKMTLVVFFERKVKKTFQNFLAFIIYSYSN